ncbi:helix-turn-helix domain-containing protein [Maribacter litoralis]|uniref:helix-turn-helix domain-containing protein n=1 Tax=Maribacter litoralis TaxID=2059726 RepID=UPI003F5CCF5E
MTLGQRIKELREKNGMLQRELSHQLSIGDAYLSKIESNQKILKREHLKVISKIFNEPIENLETLWLANKVFDLVKEENQGLNALKVAEEEIKYNTKRTVK